MKKAILTVALCFIAMNFLIAQTPRGFNFQAVARNAEGNLISGRNVDVRIQIRSGSDNGALVWQEQQTVPVNEFGLMTLVICADDALRTGGSAGSVDEIMWAADAHFLGLMIDAGNGMVDLGATQLRAVPYSLVSSSAGDRLGALEIQPETTTDPGKALFMVKREDGYPVFAVYEDGVWVYTDTVDSGKGIKGGFAVGGYNSSKRMADRQYMMVTADSTRIFVNNDPLKGLKGGFAVGGYNSGKAGDSNEFLRVTGDSTRVYVNDNPNKGIKGGFAVGGYNSNKATTTNFMTLEKENYFIGHNSGTRVTEEGLYNSVVGYESGLSITSGSSNAFIGYQSGYFNSEGSGNLFLGYQTGYSNVLGNYNTFLGYRAGHLNFQGVNNTFLGSFSGQNNIDGGFNTFVGDSTGFKNSYGYANTFLGTAAGANNTTGYSNVMVGNHAGYRNNNGGFNIFIGHESGLKNVDAGSNVYIGTETGKSSVSGWNNIYIGTNAGFENIDGEGNVFLGYQAGRNNLHGTRNVFLGNAAGYNESGSNRLYITNWDSDSTNSLVWGDFNARMIRFNEFVGVGIHPEFIPLTLYNPYSVGGLSIYGAGNGFDYSAIFLGADTTDRKNNYTISHTTQDALFIGKRSGDDYFPRIMVDNTGNIAMNGIPGTHSLSVYDTDGAADLILKGTGNGNDFATLTLESEGVTPAHSYYFAHSTSHNLAVLYNDGNNLFPRMIISPDGNLSLNNWSLGTQVLDVNGNGRFRNVGSSASAFDLRLTSNGTLTTSASDARMKNSVEQISDGLKKVLSLNGVTFSWNDDNSGKRDAGLIAQDVQEVYPEAVFINPNDGFYGVNYSRFPALFVEAIKDQQQMIEEQRSEIDELKERLAEMEMLLRDLK